MRQKAEKQGLAAASNEPPATVSAEAQKASSQNLRMKALNQNPMSTQNHYRGTP